MKTSLEFSQKAIFARLAGLHEVKEIETEMCGYLYYNTDNNKYLDNQSRWENVWKDGIREEEADTRDNTDTWPKWSRKEP